LVGQEKIEKDGELEREQTICENAIRSRRNADRDGDPQLLLLLFLHFRKPTACLKINQNKHVSSYYRQLLLLFFFTSEKQLLFFSLFSFDLCRALIESHINPTTNNMPLFA
jgi:hypothetical protein